MLKMRKSNTSIYVFQRAFFLFSTLYMQCRSLKSLSVLSWNINGLRSLIKHDKEGTVLNYLSKY